MAVTPFAQDVGTAAVPNLDPLADAITGVFDRRRERQALERADELAATASGVSPEGQEITTAEQDAALAQLALRSPQAANAIRQTIVARDAATAARMKAQVDKTARQLASVRRAETPQQQDALIAQYAAAAVAEGQDPQDWLELRNLQGDERESRLVAELSETEIGAKALESMLGTGEFGKTLVAGRDADGNPVFARTAPGGGVEIIEGFTPPPDQTPAEIRREQLDTRRVELANLAAEQKTAEKANQTERANSAKRRIGQLAASLLTRPTADSPAQLAEDVDDLFGFWDGITFAMQEGTLDAQATLDQITNLLTLASSEQMTGVLSDSDFRLLARASSVLSNQQISEAKALEALTELAQEYGGLDNLTPAEAERRQELLDKQGR